jgi:hypothetical protein
MMSELSWEIGDWVVAVLLIALYVYIALLLRAK